MPRIVQCPKCRALLQEPPPGSPYYQCGSCSTTLQAKHATRSPVESINLRTNQVEKQSRRSNSNSSAGEISDRGGDEHTYGGEGSPSWSPSRNERDSPSHASRRDIPSSFRPPEMQSDHAGELTSTESRASDQPGLMQSQNERMILNYMQTLSNQELDMKQLAQESVAGAEYIKRMAAKQEFHSGVREYRSPNTSASHNNFGYNVQQIQSQAQEGPTSSYNGSKMGKDYEKDAAFQVDSMQQQQPTDHELNSPGILKQTKVQSSHMTTSSVRTSKLRWQTSRTEAEEEILSSREVEVMTNTGMNSDNRIAPGSRNVKETTSVEYVVERNWRGLPSQRRREERQGNDGQHLQRTQSDGSEKNSDMYENQALIGEYDASENSSTMDEGEQCEAGGGESYQTSDTNVGGLSPPPSLHLPDLRNRRLSQSTPNLSRANTAIGRNVNSGDSSPQASTGLDGLDNATPHLVPRLNRRQHSWDEGATSINFAARSSEPGLRKSSSGDYRAMVLESGLRKSSSEDHMAMVSEHERLHNRGSSDPGAVSQASIEEHATSQRPLRQQQQVSTPNNQPQQQWVTRLVPKGPTSASMSSPRPPTGVQWPQKSSVSNLPPPYSESKAPLPTQASSPSYSAQHQPAHHPLSKQLSESVGPGAQLPPKHENYPPLPPPGALPHVLCQHCRTLLAVPENLPPPKKNTQKLRCGACLRILIFSVPQVLDSYPSRSEHSLGQSIRVSSFGSQSDLNSGYRTSGRSFGGASDDFRKSGRGFSDLSEKSLSVSRNDSLGSVDTPSEEDLAERVGSVKIGSFSNQVVTMDSETSILASYSEMSPSHSKFRRSPTPFVQRVGGGSSSNQHVDERSRLAVHHRAPASKRHEEGITSSDSESDSVHHNPPSMRSPQMEGHRGHTHSNSRSPPLHPNSSPVFDSSGTSPSGHGPGEHVAKEPSHEQPRVFSKAIKGFIGIKSSFLSRQSRHSQGSNIRSKVTINGQQIPDNIVKKAEEHAGVIHPGNYWYDAQAGFWGTAGGPCLGMIPPFIEEFNYPMTRDCAGGRTGILVNGRELHIKDLEKLARRGLPNTRGKSYRIEIDGRVVDVASGEELRSLGRLAPTLEHTERGTGMRPLPG